MKMMTFFFFFSSRRRHTRLQGDWSSDVCSSDLGGVRASCSPTITRVGVFTFPTSDSGDRFQYAIGSSHGIFPNQYFAMKLYTSTVSTSLVQSMTGFCDAAARKRFVFPTIHAVRTPPPEPPVTYRRLVSIEPFAMAASTTLIRSS